MAKVTCRACGKKIDKKIAVAVPRGKTTWNYCPAHVGMKSPKDQMYDLVFEIFGRTVTHTVLFKELDAIAKIYTYEKITAYLEENKEYLEDVIYGKSYSSEFAQIRYFSAIIKNSIHEFEIKDFKPVIKKEVEIEMDISTSKYKNKKKRTGMDSLLEDLLNGE